MATVHEGEIVRTDTGFYKIIGGTAGGAAAIAGGEAYQAVPAQKAPSGYVVSSNDSCLINLKGIIEVVWPRYRRIRWQP